MSLDYTKLSQLLIEMKSILDSSSSEQMEEAFCSACEKGQLEVAQMLNLLLYPTLTMCAKQAFLNACSNGHLEVAQWLYQIKPTLDISAANEYTFQCACSNGHLEVAQWLYQIKPTLDIYSACANGHLQVAQWLHEIIGIEQAIRNANLQIRCESHNPQLSAGPWNESTIEPDPDFLQRVSAGPWNESTIEPDPDF